MTTTPNDAADLLAENKRLRNELNALDKALRCEGWPLDARLVRAKQLAEDATIISGHTDVLAEIASIAHEGGLKGTSESLALVLIRQLTLKYWGNAAGYCKK